MSDTSNDEQPHYTSPPSPVVRNLKCVDAESYKTAEALLDDLLELAKERDALRSKVDELTKEGAALAANQCHNGYAGEHGHHGCREIDRLTKVNEYWEERFNVVCKERDEFWDERDQARKQRDEARRECCMTWEVVMGREARDVAADKGWDCFDNLSENT